MPILTCLEPTTGKRGKGRESLWLHTNNQDPPRPNMVPVHSCNLNTIQMYDCFTRNLQHNPSQAASACKPAHILWDHTWTAYFCSWPQICSQSTLQTN
ncbi:unnamed protein product [Ixodes pacificus]